MSKIVQILILSSLFSTSSYAIDLNSTNEILEEATEATKELAIQLEPLVNNVVEEIVEVEEESNKTIMPINEESLIEIEQPPLESESLIQPHLTVENIEINQTTIIEPQTSPIEENLTTQTLQNSLEVIPLDKEPLPSFEKMVIENNTTKEVTLSLSLTEEKKEEVIEKSVIEKDVVEKGDPRQGKNIFKYVLKEDCNMTAYKFAEKHTQEEWLEILEENKVKETIIKTCPNVEKYYQDKWTDDLYQFFYEASNEDEIPEC